MNLTPATVKAFYRNESSLLCIASVLVARDHAAAERAKVDAYTLPILASYGFKRDCDERCDGSPITRVGDLYLSGDDEGLKAFDAACDAANAEHGYELEPGHCPALIAGHAVVKAENALLEAASEHYGIPFDGPLTLELRAKVLDLLTNPPTK